MFHSPASKAAQTEDAVQALHVNAAAGDAGLFTATLTRSSSGETPFLKMLSPKLPMRSQSKNLPPLSDGIKNPQKQTNEGKWRHDRVWVTGDARTHTFNTHGGSMSHARGQRW